jgi:hypothetical protein
MDQYAEGYVEELSSECAKWEDIAQSLADALEEMLAFEGEEVNDRARAALAKYKGE